MSYFTSTAVSAILALVYTVLIFLTLFFTGFSMSLIVYAIIFTVIFLFTVFILAVIKDAADNKIKQRH